MPSEREPSLQDDKVKNTGAVAGLVVATSVFIATLGSDASYNHDHSEVSTLQGNIDSLHTSASLLGNNKGAQPALQQLNAEVVVEQKSIQRLNQHEPHHLSFGAEMGIVFAPAVLAGVAAMALANKVRKTRYKEHVAYKNLAKELMATNGNRPAPQGPLFASQEY